MQNAPITTSDFVKKLEENFGPHHKLTLPAISEIVMAINTYRASGKIPYFVYCVGTGVKSGVTSLQQREKLLARYENDIVKLFTTYTGRAYKATIAPAVEKPAHDGTYLPLATSFTSKGFKFEQLKRENDAALFKKTKISKEGEEVGLPTYEVIQVQRHNGLMLGGQWMSPREFYPSSESWGTKAWTYMAGQEERAETRFKFLAKQP